MVIHFAIIQNIYKNQITNIDFVRLYYLIVIQLSFKLIKSSFQNPVV